MKPSEEQWNRWIDGDLPPEEVEAMEAAAREMPELAEDQAFFSRLSDDLKQTFPAERTPPFADFFNSHLQKQIRDLEEAPAPVERRSWWPDWMRLSWVVPLAAAAVLVFALTQIGVIGGHGVSGSQIVYAYTPDESIEAQVDFNEDANATVMRLQGLDPLPTGFDLLLADGSRPEVNRPIVVEADLPDDDFDDGAAFVFVGPQTQFTSHRATY